MLTTLLIDCFVVSPAIQGEHIDKKIYTYKIGICTPPDINSYPNCGIVQYDRFENGSSDPSTSKCLGKIDSTQLAESNLYSIVLFYTCIATNIYYTQL